MHQEGLRRGPAAFPSIHTEVLLLPESLRPHSLAGLLQLREEHQLARQ
jgi:hypothetical protein